MPKRLVGWLLLALGLTALTVSIIYESTILAFIGLGLTFWGALSLYISPEKYVKQALLDSTITPSLINLNQILSELRYQGKPIYLPPKYFRDFETTRIFIAKNKRTKLPTAEEIQQQGEKTLLESPESALITPPGLSLSKLFEKTLGTTFTKVDLEYLRQNLPKLLIEDLEVAENVEIETEYKDTNEITDSISENRIKNNLIHVKITKSIFTGICNENRRLSQISCTIGCPLCSAIACALTKATGEPIVIERFQTSENGEIIETTYRVLEITEPQEEAEKATTESAEIIEPHPSRLSKVAGLFLIACGSAILAWICWLTWFEIATGSKDFILIFFGSRTNDPISLGIGMRVIYYFLIGLALIFSGLITLLRRRWSKP